MVENISIRLLHALTSSTDHLRQIIPGFAGAGLSMQSPRSRKDAPGVHDYVVEILVKNNLVGDARLAAGDTVTLNVEDEGEVTLPVKIQSLGSGHLEEKRKQSRGRHR